jgi:tetratricopeptide (TPR) repeat protein
MRRLALAALVALSLLPFGPTARADDAAAEPAEKLLASADYGEAKTAIDQLRGKDAARAALLDSQLALATGDYAGAAKAADAAKKDAKLAARAAAVKGEALAATGKLDDAIAALKEVEKDPDARRARLLLGELLIRQGKRSEARAPLMSLISDYNNDAISGSDAEGLSMVGRAAHLLRSARDANDAYNDAEKAGAKKRVETLLWRADLFLDKYDPGHAGQVVAEAEKLAPNDPRVRVAKARVMLANAMDFDGAESEVKRALAVNPNLPDAYYVRAGLALRDLDIEAADKAADAGLKINPRDLELLSMKAAIRFLADDKPGFAAFEKKVLGENPEYSALYQTIGEYAEWEHRYDDIIDFMQRAVAIDARDSKAYGELGLNLIRTGRETEGVEALKKAWDQDRFNVRVFNTLNLYDRDISNGYVTVDGQPFRIRYAKSERAILERYVPNLLDEAWKSMVKRYGFTPKTPVAIELYADEEHFSVRTSGLPNVGIQGVCFGQTLALMSPGAGPFNWGNVLWHELGHVFAIQMSKNHVPRWFTEGLSEYETIVRRPEWQREEDPALFAALKAKRIPAVEGFNKAFTHVDSVEDVTMAYYAASQIIVFLVDTYGWDKVVTMLPRWGKGERTEAVVQGALGVSAAEVDRAYRTWLDKRLARYDHQYVPDLHSPPLEDAEDAAKKTPKDARKQVDLALARLREGDDAGGRAALDAALALDPKQPDALYMLADLALAGHGKAHARVKSPKEGGRPVDAGGKAVAPGGADAGAKAGADADAGEGDEEKARAAEASSILQRMIDGGADGYAVRMKLARIADATDDYPAARASLEAASKLDPSQSAPVAGLISIARKTHDGRSEVAQLRRYVLLEQHDRSAWNRLLEGLVQRYKWDDAVKVGESAIYVDVANPEVHRLYARALANSGRHLTAVYEYNSALIAGAPPEMATEIYRELAKGYDKLGQPKLAEQARAYEKRVAAKAGKSPKDD